MSDPTLPPAPPVSVSPAVPTDAVLSVSHPLLPLVKDNIEQISAMEPGPAAQSKVTDVLALIVAMLNNPAVAAILPVGWKPWTAAAVGVLTLALAMFGTGRWTAPSTPPAKVIVFDPANPANDDPEMAFFRKNFVDLRADVAALKASIEAKPAPVVPTPIAKVRPVKLVFFVTSEAPAEPNAALLNLITAQGISLDIRTLTAGTTYGFQGKVYALPVAVLRDAKDADLDVVPMPTDLAAFVQRNVR